MSDDTVRFRKDLLVVGVGNPLRGDDSVGLHLLDRLKKHFLHRINTLELYAPDVILAETFSAYRTLFIIDAMKGTTDIPFKVIPLTPSPSKASFCCLSSHFCKWENILCLSECLYGSYPESYLIGIGAYDFCFSETMSDACRNNAEKAFEFLIRYCSEGLPDSELKVLTNGIKTG